MYYLARTKFASEVLEMLNVHEWNRHNEMLSVDLILFFIIFIYYLHILLIWVSHYLVILSSWEANGPWLVMKFPAFMETWDTPRCSEKPTSCVVLSQINQFLKLVSSFFKIHFNINLPPVPRLLNLVTSDFVKKVCVSYSSYVCYMPRPSHLP
jgi:hypothetical protein